LDEKDACPCLVAVPLEKKEACRCLEAGVLGKKEADLLVLILSYFKIWWRLGSYFILHLRIYRCMKFGLKCISKYIAV